MSTHVHESAVINASVDKVWAKVRPLDFAFLPDVKAVEIDEKANPATVGNERTVVYNDGTKQRIRLTELSDANRFVTYELIESEPAITVLSVVHTIRLHRVTVDNSTYIDFVSDFSKDATHDVIQDSRYKKVDFFKALQKAVVPQ